MGLFSIELTIKTMKAENDNSYLIWDAIQIPEHFWIVQHLVAESICESQVVIKLMNSLLCLSIMCSRKLGDTRSKGQKKFRSRASVFSTFPEHRWDCFITLHAEELLSAASEGKYLIAETSQLRSLPLPCWTRALRDMDHAFLNRALNWILSRKGIKPGSLEISLQCSMPVFGGRCAGEVL